MCILITLADSKMLSKKLVYIRHKTKTIIQNDFRIKIGYAVNAQIAKIAKLEKGVSIVTRYM